MVRAEVNGVLSELWKLTREALDKGFSFSAWTTISFVYPPAPYVFEIFFTWGLDSLDIILNGLQRIFPRIAASIILDEFIPDPKLRQRVMPLDQVAKFPLKVLLDQGIIQIQTGQPNELALYNIVDTFTKRIQFYKAPSFKNLFKLLFGSLFGKILRIFWLVVQMVQLFAIVGVMYRYVKIMSDVKSSERLMTAAFPQTGARVWGRLVKRSNINLTLDRKRYVRTRRDPLQA